MPFDIFALRPKSNTSEAIRAALDKVAATEVEQATQLRQAREERDRLLLDGTPAALAKAQAVVTAAVEPAEQITTNRPSAGHLAAVDILLARAAAFGGGRMTASAGDISPSPADPSPAAPSTPADTAARLDAQETHLADHEARIAGLEQRSPPPAVDTGDQAAPAAASAIAPVSTTISASAIYARLNSRSTGQKVIADAAPPPAMIHTSAGPMLNARAIHDRHNAVAAARAGRGARG